MMTKALLTLTLLLLASPLYAESRGQGYVTMGVIPMLLGNAGAEAIAPSGWSVAGDIIVTPYSVAPLVSGLVGLHPRVSGRAKPFFHGGLMSSGSHAWFSLGGGVNYWSRSRVGLRAETRLIGGAGLMVNLGVIFR